MEFAASICSSALVFLVSLYILNKFIFKPTMALIDHRKEDIDGLREESLQIEKKNIILQNEYNERIEGINQLADEKKEISSLIGKRRAEMLITEAKKGFKRDIENIKKKSDESFTAVKPSINSIINEYSKKISNKILSG